MKHALTILFLFSSALSAQSANQFVRCVQNQLVAMGHNPGPIDGALGKRTRAALTKAVENKSEYSDMPRISNRFAVSWCRVLGKESFLTRRHMPALDDILVKSDLAPGSEIEQNIRTQLRDLRVWYAQAFGIRTASRPIVVIAQSGSSAVSLGRKALKEVGEREGGEKSIRQKCKNPHKGNAAFAGAHVMYFCLTQLDDDGRTISVDTKNFLARAVPHEYFHSVQHDLAADKVPRYYRKGTRPPQPHLRPSWLVEGGADYLTYRYLYRNLPPRYLLKWSMDISRPYGHTLSTIAKNRQLSKSEHYAVSFLAATVLAERSGAQSLLTYWESIGRGEKHAAAFEGAFGISQNSFEKEFETLRKDLVVATAFVLNKSD